MTDELVIRALAEVRVFPVSTGDILTTLGAASLTFEILYNC